MKNLFIAALFSLSFSTQAADMTISTTAPQATRLAAAVGARMNLRDGAGNPRSANAAEVKAFTIQLLREVVFAYERDEVVINHEKAVAPFDPT